MLALMCDHQAGAQRLDWQLQGDDSDVQQVSYTVAHTTLMKPFDARLLGSRHLGLS
jgi:hypothetical protein